MPNKKGGYKIVSLNGLDLVGESLAIAGLYDKLANSYGKPILVSGIVINGEKKKNAFVQVEVLDDGIKINDLYGYDLLVEENGGITVSANPQELPNTADASAGQVLKLNAQKKPVWGDEAEELPDVADASAGQVLKLDAQKKPVWGAIASGTKLYKHTITGLSYGPTSTTTLISLDNTPITNMSDLDVHFKKYGLRLIAGDFSHAYFEYFATSAWDNKIYMINATISNGSPELSSKGADTTTSLTDTVTEL